MKVIRHTLRPPPLIVVNTRETLPRLVSSRLASASSLALIHSSPPAAHDPTRNDVESPTPPTSSSSLLVVEHLSLVDCCVVSILSSWSSSLHHLVLIVASAAYRRSRLALSLASATVCLDAAFAMRRHGREVGQPDGERNRGIRL
jgi:hypothetical protein